MLEPRPPADSLTPAERLRVARLALGWTQVELARRLRITATTVSRWERGRAWPHPDHREALAQCLQLGAEHLGRPRPPRWVPIIALLLPIRRGRAGWKRP